MFFFFNSISSRLYVNKIFYMSLGMVLVEQNFPGLANPEKNIKRIEEQ
jgi:hypothetical protein